MQEQNNKILLSLSLNSKIMLFGSIISVEKNPSKRVLLHDSHQFGKVEHEKIVWCKSVYMLLL